METINQPFSSFPKDIALIRLMNQELDRHVYQEIEYYEQHRLWVKGGLQGVRPTPPELSPLARQAMKDCQQYYPKRTTDEAFEKEQLQYRELIIMSGRLEEFKRDSSRALTIANSRQQAIATLMAENEELKKLAEGLRKMVRFYADGAEIQNFLN